VNFAAMRMIQMNKQLVLATALCNSDKYSEGYTVMAKLARFIGHLEARRGVAPVL
jgi:hypothetical protein